ncbi:MAG: hypothetical protein AAGA81_01660 [Acidobacteriota bacterium]
MKQLTKIDAAARALALALFFAAATAGAAVAEDIRTLAIRVVPDTMWDAAPTAVRVEFANNSDHKKSADFTEKMGGWVEKAFGKLDYTVSEDADITFAFTVDQFDPGSAVARFAVGFGVGKSFVSGTATVRQGKKVLGSYRYSARPGGAGVKFMSKEVGPALVLQIHNREADEKLHEYKKGKKKEQETED